jgi:hypothetical protein
VTLVDPRTREIQCRQKSGKELRYVAFTEEEANDAAGDLRRRFGKATVITIISPRLAEGEVVVSVPLRMASDGSLSLSRKRKRPPPRTNAPRR